ncbi:MAG: SGNH/GDSL hydrolase family protein [Rufibacter sp.]
MKRIPLLLLLAFLMVSFSSPPKKKVLIIGDSISIGYFPFVQKMLAGQAEVVHNQGNAQHTRTGLKKINEWLGQEKWDVIQFNFGLWDLCYRNPNSENQGGRDKVNGKLTTTLEQYRTNLDSLAYIIKGTGAKVVYVTTTYVPENEAGRFPQDAQKYNKVAKEVMKKHGIPVNDLFPASKKVHCQEAIGPNDVHYSEAGYEQLGKKVAEYLQKKAL